MQQFDVDIKPLPSMGEVRTLWLELEQRATPSFYTSWSWIGAWLESLPKNLRLHLWVAHDKGQVVALGVLVRRWRKRGHLPVCEAWYLNATGDFEQDILWIEHNDLLIDRRYGDDVRKAMVAHWQKVSSGASELRLPGLPATGWCAGVVGELERVADVQSSCCVALAPVRDKKLDFTPLVSSHARRFIRRSFKEYQTLGPVTVDVATTVEEAHAYFDRLAVLSQSRWIAKGKTGVFASEFFMDFHRKLIAQRLPHGEVQLLRVRAGDKDVGLLYSFIRGGRVYVYQSGFDYTLLAKHGRPGLITHTLAIQFNAGLGHEMYDLMAGGESQYKSTLSTVSETLTWLTLRKPAVRFHLEDRIKSMLKRYLAGDASPDSSSEHGEHHTGGENLAHG